MTTYNDYMKKKTYEYQIMSKMYGDNPIHNEHIDEFHDMAAAMIDKALKEHDEQMKIDVQTTLNGQPVTMNGLVSDMKKLVMDSLRKAFKK